MQSYNPVVYMGLGGTMLDLLNGMFHFHLMLARPSKENRENIMHEPYMNDLVLVI